MNVSAISASSDSLAPWFETRISNHKIAASRMLDLPRSAHLGGNINHRRNRLDAGCEIHSLGIVYPVLKRNHIRFRCEIRSQQFRRVFRIHRLHREKN